MQINPLVGQKAAPAPAPVFRSEPLRSSNARSSGFNPGPSSDTVTFSAQYPLEGNAGTPGSNNSSYYSNPPVYGSGTYPGYSPSTNQAGPYYTDQYTIPQEQLDYLSSPIGGPSSGNPYQLPSSNPNNPYMPPTTGGTGGRSGGYDWMPEVTGYVMDEYFGGQMPVNPTSDLAGVPYLPSYAAAPRNGRSSDNELPIQTKADHDKKDI